MYVNALLNGKKCFLLFYFSNVQHSMKNVLTFKGPKKLFLMIILLFFPIQTKVEETVSKEMYENTFTVLNEITKETKNTQTFGLSFKFTPTESSEQTSDQSPDQSPDQSSDQSSSKPSISLSGGFNVEHKHDSMLKKITEYTKTKVRLAIMLFLNPSISLGHNVLDSRASFFLFVIEQELCTGEGHSTTEYL